MWFVTHSHAGGISAALADVVVSVVPQPFKAPTHMMVIIGVIGAVVVVNLGGVRRGVRLVDWVTTVKMVPLFLFLVVGVTAIHRANFVQSTPSGVQGLGRALILVVFLLTGMEVSLSASGEVKQPSRAPFHAPWRLPSASSPCCTSPSRSSLKGCWALPSQSSVPLADAMARISPVLRMVMIAGATVSRCWGGLPATFSAARVSCLPSGAMGCFPRPWDAYIHAPMYPCCDPVLCSTGDGVGVDRQFR